MALILVIINIKKSKIKRIWVFQMYSGCYSYKGQTVKYAAFDVLVYKEGT